VAARQKDVGRETRDLVAGLVDGAGAYVDAVDGMAAHRADGGRAGDDVSIFLRPVRGTWGRVVSRDSTRSSRAL
jgi:hypothetical protein